MATSSLVCVNLYTVYISFSQFKRTLHTLITAFNFNANMFLFNRQYISQLKLVNKFGNLNSINLFTVNFYTV